MGYHHDIDVLVIGAGPGGAVAATILSKNGFRVLIVERTQFPRFMIGESLLPQCMDFLDEAGLIDLVHQQGFQIKTGAAFFHTSKSQVFDFAEQYTKGWAYTYQVPRAKFDHVLVTGAIAAGSEILYKQTVVHADFSGAIPKVIIEASDGAREVIRPRFVLDASGFAGVLPRILNLNIPADFPVRESLFAHVTGDQRGETIDVEKIWVSIHPDNHQVWFWIIPFSDGVTSVGVVASPAFLASLSGTPAERLRSLLLSDPNLKTRFQNIDYVFPPKSVMGYARNVKQLYGDGFALLGNAGGFLDPIFSSGVTIAIKSAMNAARILNKQLHGQYVDWKIEFVDDLMAGVSTFKTYVQAWYDGSFQRILFFRDKPVDIKKKICSVLAGYVWDRSNAYVRQHKRRLKVLSKVCDSL